MNEAERRRKLTRVKCSGDCGFPREKFVSGATIENKPFSINYFFPNIYHLQFSKALKFLLTLTQTTNKSKNFSSLSIVSLDYEFLTFFRRHERICTYLSCLKYLHLESKKSNIWKEVTLKCLAKFITNSSTFVLNEYSQLDQHPRSEVIVLLLVIMSTIRRIYENG